MTQEPEVELFKQERQGSFELLKKHAKITKLIFSAMDAYDGYRRARLVNILNRIIDTAQKMKVDILRQYDEE